MATGFQKKNCCFQQGQNYVTGWWKYLYAEDLNSNNKEVPLPLEGFFEYR